MTKNSGKIWFSQVLRDPTLMKGFTAEFSEIDLQTVGALARKMNHVVPVAAEGCPDMISWTHPGKKSGAQPHTSLGGIHT